MRLNTRKLLLLAVLLTTCRQVQADVLVPSKLTVQEAVDLALSSNVNLKVADAARLDAASNFRKQSIYTTYGMGVTTALDRNPGLELMSSQLSGLLQFSGLGGTTSSLSLYPIGMGTQRSGVVFSLSQPILKGSGRMSDKYDAVRTAMSNAVVQNRQGFITEQSTVLGVVTAYYNAVLAREQVKVEEEAVRLAEQSAEYVRRRVDAGLERGLDVTQQEVYVAQAKDSLNQRRQSARGAVDALMIAMGVGVGQTPELTDPVPDSSTEMPDLDKAIKTALQNRNELAVYDEQLRETERKLAIKNDQLRPDMNLVASFNSSNQYPGFFSNSLLNAGAMNVGMVYNFPIDRRIGLEERSTTERAVDTLRKQRAFSEEQVTDEVRSAYRALDAARVSLGIFTQNLDVANENLRIAQRMVEEGEGDSRDVVDAQKNLADVLSSIANAKTNLYLARVTFKYAMGEDLTGMVLK